jgi:hypothetical protein
MKPAYILFGLEIEFYLENFTQDKLDVLAKEIYAKCPFICDFKPEEVPGQFEITTYPLEDIPDTENFWEILHKTCDLLDIKLIRTSRPFSDLPTSASQISISFYDSNFKPLLNAPNIPQIASNICASIVPNLDMFAPSGNCKERLKSYDLLVKYLNVPLYVCWGYENNRTTAVRVTHNHKKIHFKGNILEGTRIEFRVPSNFADMQKVGQIIAEYALSSINYPLFEPIYVRSFDRPNLRPINLSHKSQSHAPLKTP